MVEVAVIGAGAAGLVASRHLIRCGLRPCIFESCPQLGGAWNADNNAHTSSSRGAYKMWDHLTPNLSKYTCVFSDFMWPEESPTFPTKASDMHHYLDRYASKYVTVGDQADFRYGCTVTNVKRVESSSSNPIISNAAAATADFLTGDTLDIQQQYQVEWSDHASGELQSQEFAGVIIATGFFSTPVFPEGLASLANSKDSNKVIHSSQYRSPLDFSPDETVAVVGASFSALEIAADVRKHAKKVVSILPQIPWILPRYVPNTSANSAAGSYAPLDMVLYQRTREAPQVPPSIVMDAEACRARHALLQKLSGSRKQQLSPIGVPTDFTKPPLVAISDDYLNLVLDGNIDVVQGRVAKATILPNNNDDDDNENNKKDSIHLELENGSVVSGIDRIISCTGYKSQQLGSFLDASLLTTLEYDDKDTGHAPMTLCYDTFHPRLPGLGFVGMYKGPYFGIMELQARLLAGLYSGDIPKPLSQDSIERALQESKTIRDPTTPRAQFPRYDYIGMMDSLAEQLDLVPSQELGGSIGSMVSPPFYQPSKDIAEQCQQAIHRELGRTTQNGETDDDSSIPSVNMARVALSALIGTWKFERKIIQCARPAEPPQRVHGEIAFSHMHPSSAGEEDDKDDDSSLFVQKANNKNLDWNTVLYHEQGIFLLQGKEMDVFRKYEYELKENGILEIYFVELGKRAHLFLSLKFQKEQDGYWVATSDHLCIKDLYSATFKIKFDGIGASEVIQAYRVRGPSKDYESITVLTPK